MLFFLGFDWVGLSFNSNKRIGSIPRNCDREGLEPLDVRTDQKPDGEKPKKKKHFFFVVSEINRGKFVAKLIIVESQLNLTNIDLKKTLTNLSLLYSPFGLKQIFLSLKSYKSCKKKNSYKSRSLNRKSASNNKICFE
jgi:hypothetical protein